MGERRRGLVARLAPWLVVFVAGGAAGYYVRDTQQDERVREAVERRLAEMEERGQQAVERGRRVTEGVKAGAKAAAESTKAAVKEMGGDSARDRD